MPAQPCKPTPTPDEAKIGYDAISVFLGKGNLEAAGVLLRALANDCESNFGLQMAAAKICEAQARPGQAIWYYDRAIAARPGHGLPFTRRAVLLARRHLNTNTVVQQVAAAERCVSMSSLGANGRFGNQLLQYAGLRLYAERAGAVACTPDWIGRDLFGLTDPLVGAAPLPTIPEAEAAKTISGGGEPKAGVNLCGYFGEAVCRRHDAAEKFRRFFTPVPAVQQYLSACRSVLQQQGDTIVAIHLRRGDFDGVKFWIAPCEWYHAWLASLWSSLCRPVLYIATDDRRLVSEFSSYKPYCSEDMPSPIPGAEFLGDHWILRTADVVGCSPSTFSSTACMLNAQGAKFFMPDRSLQKMVPWSPWAN